MSLKKIFLTIAVLLSFAAFLHAAELATQAVPALAASEKVGEGQSSPAATTEHAEAHGLPSAAVPVFNVGPLPVTNSMLVTWIVAVSLIIFAQVAMRNVQSVPAGLQNFWEWMVESLYEFLEGIVGPELVKKTFWFFATIFIFILFTNWFGLLPGLNMTFAMAAIFMILWLIWALRSNGIVGFALHIFGPKGDNAGFIKYMMIVVFFLVGFLEVVSIAFRPISLSFRLYGNVFAGENLLEAMSNVIQHPAWAKTVFSVLLPVPFYVLELLVGVVQAFVFMLLTTVFTALICAHDEEQAKEHHH